MENSETILVECDWCNQDIDAVESVLIQTPDKHYHFCDADCEFNYEDQFIKTYGLNVEQLWTR